MFGLWFMTENQCSVDCHVWFMFMIEEMNMLLWACVCQKRIGSMIENHCGKELGKDVIALWACVYQEDMYFVQGSLIEG